MNSPRMLVFVMAGGQGERLRPFTRDCAKPALPFGGGYRIIDFVLSNLHNSGLPQVCVLLQYRPSLLAQHIARHWSAVRGANGRFVRALLPRSAGVELFQGTANSVACGLQAIDGTEPDVIAVFAADHVYRMDVRQMIDFHRERDAEATVAAVPVPLERARAFGVIVADSDGRILGFQEKPERPQSRPEDPRRAFASMGNYLFKPDALRAALAEAQARGEHDFGRHVLPRMIDRHRVFAYDFARNRVPGARPEEEAAYWRDVGTVDAYVEAQWDLLGPEPRFRLDNQEWPIRCGDSPRVLGSLDGGELQHSIVGPGVQFQGAAVRHSVLQRGAHVEPGAEIERCILMEGVRVAKGVRLDRTIVGRGNLLTAQAHGGRSARSSRWPRSPAGMTIVPPRAGRVAHRQAVPER